MSCENGVVWRHYYASNRELMSRHLADCFQFFEIRLLLVTIQLELILDTVVIVESHDAAHLLAWYDRERTSFRLSIDYPSCLFAKMD